MTKTILQMLAVGALVVCLASAVARFRGGISDEEFKTLFLIATVGWFLFATAAFSIRRPS